MKKSGKIKIILPVASIILVAVIVALSVLNAPVKVTNNNYTNGKTAVEFSDDFNIYIGDDNVRLYFNSINGAVSFKYGNKAEFNANSKNAADSGLANIVSVRLRDKKGNIYSLDSSANAVPFSLIKAEKEGDSIKADLTLFPNEEEKEKGIENASVFAYLPIEFTYENSKFTVSLNTENVALPKGMYIETVNILPGLFSAGVGENGSFYTVPDGSGATVDLYKVTENSITHKMPVYGNDVAFYDYSEGALLPYFAYTKNNVLINCVIENGDAISEISLKRNNLGGGYLYNTFTVTPCVMNGEKLIVGDSYEGVISQSYTLTEGDNNYNEVAAQVRDSLVRKGYLNDSLNGIYNDFPFFIQLLGSPDGKDILTTFENSAEITAFLKSRGVRNISLRLSGFNKKGLKSTAESNGSFMSSLGGKQGYETLANALEEQGNTLWLDTNLSVKSESSKEDKLKIYDTESKLLGVTPKEFSVSGIEYINKKISESYNLVTSLSNTDICLNDMAQFLYSDVKGSINRQEMLDNIKDKTDALSASGNLMLSYPAVYLMSGADSVFTLPEVSTLDGTDGVKSLPILQMVLHGSVVYGSSPLNVTSLSDEDALLRCIEYGSVPSFIFTYKDEGALSYSAYSAKTAQFYTKAKSLLPVMDMKITSHEMIADNVYKVTYDYSKIIYVNYNPSAVKVDGIMVSAKDFVVI